MPTYEYECKACGRKFEIFQAMSDPPVQNCPDCGKEVRRLIFGGAGVIFKGSGFYVTDKSKDAGKSKPAAEPVKDSSAKTDAAKPATTQKAAVSEGGNSKSESQGEKTKPEAKSQPE